MNTWGGGGGFVAIEMDVRVCCYRDECEGLFP